MSGEEKPLRGFKLHFFNFRLFLGSGLHDQQSLARSLVGRRGASTLFLTVVGKERELAHWPSGGRDQGSGVPSLPFLQACCGTGFAGLALGGHSAPVVLAS